MKALGEAATHLAWLCPSAASLVALARSPTATVWQEVRDDPGAVLLILRQAPDPPVSPILSCPPVPFPSSKNTGVSIMPASRAAWPGAGTCPVGWSLWPDISTSASKPPKSSALILIFSVWHSSPSLWRSDRESLY